MKSVHSILGIVSTQICRISLYIMNFMKRDGSHGFTNLQKEKKISKKLHVKIKKIKYILGIYIVFKLHKLIG